MPHTLSAFALFQHKLLLWPVWKVIHTLLLHQRQKQHVKNESNCCKHQLTCHLSLFAGPYWLILLFRSTFYATVPTQQILTQVLPKRCFLISLRSSVARQALYELGPKQFLSYFHFSFCFCFCFLFLGSVQRQVVCRFSVCLEGSACVP